VKENILLKIFEKRLEMKKKRFLFNKGREKNIIVLLLTCILCEVIFN